MYDNVILKQENDRLKEMVINMEYDRMRKEEFINELTKTKNKLESKTAELTEEVLTLRHVQGACNESSQYSNGTSSPQIQKKARYVPHIDDIDAYGMGMDLKAQNKCITEQLSQNIQQLRRNSRHSANETRKLTSLAPPSTMRTSKYLYKEEDFMKNMEQKTNNVIVNNIKEINRDKTAYAEQ